MRNITVLAVICVAFVLLLDSVSVPCHAAENINRQPGQLAPNSGAKGGDDTVFVMPKNEHGDNMLTNPMNHIPTVQFPGKFFLLSSLIQSLQTC
jgi:hypothetical protein